MASVTVTLSGLPKDQNSIGFARDTPRDMVKNLDNLLWQVMQGAMANANPKLFVSYSANDAVYASQTYTLSSASGTITATIDGTAVNTVTAGGDTASAALEAANINANTTVNKKVVATSSGAVVTVTALIPGAIGNKITTTGSGTGHTAGGATLAGGAGADTPSGLLANNF